MNILSLMLFLSLGLLAGCGDKEKTDMAEVKVGFKNDTITKLKSRIESESPAGISMPAPPEGSSGTVTDHDETRLAYPASTFGTKLIQIYLIPDVGDNGWDNVGRPAYIYINSICGTTTDEDGSISMANGGNCDTTKITEYFEFARPSAEVNEDLNAQKTPVPVGTYKYIRVQVCDNETKDENVQFASTDSGLTTVATGRTGNCVMVPAKIDPRLEVEKDDSVEVTLTYDLSTALIDYNYDLETNTYTTVEGEVPENCAKPQTGEGVRCVRDFVYTASVRTP